MKKHFKNLYLLALLSTVVLLSLTFGKVAYADNYKVTHKNKSITQKDVATPQNNMFSLISYSSSYYNGNKKEALFSEFKVNPDKTIICDTKDYVKDDDCVIKIDSHIKNKLTIKASGTVAKYSNLLKTMLLLSGIDNMEVTLKSSKVVDLSKLYTNLYELASLSTGKAVNKKMIAFQKSLIPYYEELYLTSDKNLQDYVKYDLYKDLIDVINARHKLGKDAINSKFLLNLNLGTKLSKDNYKTISKFLIDFGKNIPNYKVDIIFNKEDSLLLIASTLAKN